MVRDSARVWLKDWIRFRGEMGSLFSGVLLLLAQIFFNWHQRDCLKKKSKQICELIMKNLHDIQDG